MHNGFDTHSIGLLRYIISTGKEPLVGFNSILSQIHAMYILFKGCTWLIKANMAIVTNAQKLHINATKALNQLSIALGFFLTIHFHAIREIGFIGIDIYPVKQVLVHEIIVALVIVLGQAFVLVKVYGSNLGEIQIPLFVPFHQLVINPNRRGTSGQSQGAVWLHNNLG